MSNGGGFAYPDYEQAVAFHRAVLRRLGLEESGEIQEAKLRGTLERALSVAQQQRGDILMLASFLLYGLVRDQPFGSGSTQTGVALTLAFLLRNSVAVMAPDEEVAAVGVGIARGDIYVGMVESWLRQAAQPIRR